IRRRHRVGESNIRYATGNVLLRDTSSRLPKNSRAQGLGDGRVSRGVGAAGQSSRRSTTARNLRPRPKVITQVVFSSCPFQVHGPCQMADLQESAAPGNCPHAVPAATVKNLRTNL